MGKGSVKERRRSCTNIEGLQEALRPWVTCVNFVAYTHDRSLRLQNVVLFSWWGCFVSRQKHPSPEPNGTEAVFTPRCIKQKDVTKMTAYLPHLQRVQKVDRTWNFCPKTIHAALMGINEDTVAESMRFTRL